jgi:hypothetical protein
MIYGFNSHCPLVDSKPAMRQDYRYGDKSYFYRSPAIEGHEDVVLLVALAH